MGDVMQVEGTADEAIALLVASQHGLVTRDQLLEAGLGRGAIDHRVARGRLHRVHRGVYLLGHRAAPPLAREMAAILACGPEAVLSHRSAAWLWGMLRRHEGEGDVTVTGRDARRPGVCVHRARRLEARERTRREGLAVTTPVRTLIDLAEVASERELERALSGAQAHRLVHRSRLRELLARTPPGRRGAAALTALLRREAGPALTRSEA